MNSSKSLIVILLIAISGHVMADTPQSPLKAPSLQAWQVRRAKLDQAILGARQNNADALKQFDQMLTEMEQHPLARTPLEALDIIGSYYLPNEGIESSLGLIVTQLTLGWYDVLRFASPSGRAEIIDNEQFFKRALVLSGKDVTDKSFEFLKNHQDRVSQLVTEGLSYADRFRDTTDYDRQWPTAYGLERILCASGDAGKCNVSLLPKDQWDTAWAKSKQAVSDYFLNKH
jgi:hypothetical protein